MKVSKRWQMENDVMKQKRSKSFVGFLFWGLLVYLWVIFVNYYTITTCWNDKILRPIGVFEEQEKLRWMFDGFFYYD